MISHNHLCADIGYMSLNHAGEQLCGDHVEIAGAEDHSTVIVLADGLGSGVKASILSTLTSKIISTMLAAGLRLEDCVETIAATLPVCSSRGIAYSTFTILRLVNNERAEIIQYDNPAVILLRDGKSVELPATMLTVGGKNIYRTDVALRENDLFLALSDGVVHAGVGGVYNFGWRREDIARYMETFWHVGFTAKTLTTILLQETNRLYDGQTGRRRDGLRRAHPLARADEPALRPAREPGRQREDDVALLSQGGETHHLRGYDCDDRGGIPEPPGPDGTDVSRSGYSAVGFDRGVRSCDGGRHHDQPRAGIREKLSRRQQRV